MRRFKNILFCPLGHKDNAAALRRVAVLADHNHANLTMFGAVAAPTRLQRLLHNIECGRTTTAHEVLPPMLVVRGTTAPVVH